MNKPVWNVYIYNINLQKIEVCNIFDHAIFNYCCGRMLAESISKEAFAEQIKNELRYYFWGKCEWEIEIVDWMGHQKNGFKTDVFKQVELNFDAFVDYVWRFRDEA